MAHAPSDIINVEELHLFRFGLGWCVTVFFGLSGWIEAYLNIPEGFKLYAKRRAVRLLVPYFALYIGYGVILHVLSRNGFVRAPTISRSSLFSNILMGYAPQLYFLSYLWLIGCSCFYLLRKSPIAFSIGLAVAQATSRLLIPASDYGYGSNLHNIMGYFASFAIGYAWQKERYWPTLAICIASGVLEIILYGSYTAMHPIFAIVLIHVLTIIPYWLNNLLSSLGKWSFAIYLWHVPIIMPATSLLLRGLQPSGFKLCSVLTITGFLCVGIGKMLSRIPYLWRLAK